MRKKKKIKEIEIIISEIMGIVEKQQKNQADFEDRLKKLENIVCESEKEKLNGLKDVGTIVVPKNNEANKNIEPTVSENKPKRSKEKPLEIKDIYGLVGNVNKETKNLLAEKLEKKQYKKIIELLIKLSKEN